MRAAIENRLSGTPTPPCCDCSQSKPIFKAGLRTYTFPALGVVRNLGRPDPRRDSLRKQSIATWNGHLCSVAVINRQKHVYNADLHGITLSRTVIAKDMDWDTSLVYLERLDTARIRPGVHFEMCMFSHANLTRMAFDSVQFSRESLKAISYCNTLRSEYLSDSFVLLDFGVNPEYIPSTYSPLPFQRPNEVTFPIWDRNV